MAETRTPSDLLATVLLGEREAAMIAARETGERKLWDNAVRLALMWRALPQLRTRIADLSVDTGSPARTSLISLGAAAAAESGVICRGAGIAMSGLDRAGIRTAAFKGLGMIASVYGSPGRRMLNDVDMLVQKTDFPAATLALGAVGFKPAISIGLDEWFRMLEERVYPAHDFLDFVNDMGVRIDVHWTLRTPAGKGFSIGEILGRSVALQLGSGMIRVVSPEDSILLTAHHLVRDRLSPRSAVKDLADIQAWLELSGVRWTIGTLDDRARNAGLSTSLLAALRILESFAPGGSGSVAAAGISAGCSRKESRIADRLASLFLLQLRGAVVSEMVMGMTAATPRLVGRFVLSRLRSLTDARYRRNKFPGQQSRTPVPVEQIRPFFRDLFTMTPTRFAQYRALATETRRYLRSTNDTFEA